MAGHEVVAEPPVALYNEAYVTEFGLKTIRLPNRESIVHDTSNLDSLIDAYFREEQGGLPRNFKEYVTAAKLANPTIHFLLRLFMRLNPELAEQLRIVSSRRELEQQVEAERRTRIERGSVGWTDLKNDSLPDKEQAFRDFLYSQVVDKIGDIVKAYGLDFKLGELLV